ncbi:MAG: hypothetical protein IJ031_00665 [Oscillospiraceae bacterium]|nr:hypothetical protein [Oscillospiraceae bacterium]
MASLTLTLYSKTTTHTLTKCVNLQFEKERYTPYTKASGVFVCEETPDEIYKMRITLDSVGIHYGPVDSFEFYKEKGISYVKFSSRGFSMGLSQNQPKPGMNLNVNLQSLIDANITVPYVSCEQDTEVANYIFVKETSSLWDAVVALCQKTEGGYPYISGENKIMFSQPATATLDLSAEKIVKSGSGVHLTNVISDFHMKDTEDEYSYNYTNTVSSGYEIVRHKYINLDRQWLSDPDGGLMHKGYFSGKGIRYDFRKFVGCHFADLCEKVKLSSSSTKAVSRVLLEYNKNGFFTTLWFYVDNYQR